VVKQLKSAAGLITGQARRYRIAGELLTWAIARQGKFVRSGDIDDLNTAIESFRRAIALTPEKHPDRLRQSFGLASALTMRYEEVRHAADLRFAILAFERAVRAIRERPDDIVAGGIPIASAVALNLGKALQRRGELTGGGADLDRAIGLARDVLDSADDAMTRGHALTSLSRLFRVRYRLTGDRADLDTGIELAQQAQPLIAGDDAQRASVLSDLVTLHCARFCPTGTA
jgi:hypothetical protein